MPTNDVWGKVLNDTKTEKDSDKRHGKKSGTKKYVIALIAILVVAAVFYVFLLENVQYSANTNNAGVKNTNAAANKVTTHNDANRVANDLSNGINDISNMLGDISSGLG
jgi:uncharacterized protein HemX